jgi:hypothetical protein
MRRIDETDWSYSLQPGGKKNNDGSESSQVNSQIADLVRANDESRKEMSGLTACVRGVSESLAKAVPRGLVLPLVS